MAESSEVIELLENPFNKVYWFARWLIATEYGGIGNGTLRMESLAQALSNSVDQVRDDISVGHQIIRNVLLEGRQPNTAIHSKVESLCARLEDELKEPIDFDALIVAVKHVIIPTNGMIQNIPSDDVAFARTKAIEFLDQYGEAGVVDLINVWDMLGTQGSIAAERTEVVREFGVLRDFLNQREFSSLESTKVLSAFVQEFERRAAQKRKTRAGHSLQDVTGLILDYFGIRGETPTGREEHVTRALEMDRVVTNRRGEKIGISCKRTSRERWKQARPAPETLEAAGFKEMWAVVTLDQDVSDEMVRSFGRNGGIFYLGDDSPRYIQHSKNPQLANYVRPLSRFVSDLRRFVQS